MWIWTEALTANIQITRDSLDRIMTLGSISRMCDKFWKELHANKIQNMWQWLHNTGLNNKDGPMAQGQRLRFNYPYIYKLCNALQMSHSSDLWCLNNAVCKFN